VARSKWLDGFGCGDSSCRYGSAGGMCTNGGCRCVPSMSDVRRDPMTPRREMARMIRRMREMADALDEAR
jgi:hypothetical protein